MMQISDITSTETSKQHCNGLDFITRRHKTSVTDFCDLTVQKNNLNNE